MFCPKCGEKNPDGAKFCAKCGAPFAPAPAVPAAAVPARRGPSRKLVVAAVVAVLVVGSAAFGVWLAFFSPSGLSYVVMRLQQVYPSGAFRPTKKSR